MVVGKIDNKESEGRERWTVMAGTVGSSEKEADRERSQGRNTGETRERQRVRGVTDPRRRLRDSWIL